MPATSQRRQRARQKAAERQFLLEEAFQASLQPSPVSAHRRVLLLLAVRDVAKQDVASWLGVTTSTCSRWLSGTCQSPKLSAGHVATTLSGPLRAPAVWIETGSLAAGIPEGLDEFHAWVDALTAIAAVQLYGALTLRCCPPAYLAVLDESALQGVRLVSDPFPSLLTEPYRQAWTALMRTIPFISADAQSSLLTWWRLIEQTEPNPNRLIGMGQESIIHLASSWAMDWARKVRSGATATRRQQALAAQFLRRGLALRRYSGPGPYFAQLGISEPVGS